MTVTGRMSMGMNMSGPLDRMRIPPEAVTKAEAELYLAALRKWPPRLLRPFADDLAACAETNS